MRLILAIIALGLLIIGFWLLRHNAEAPVLTDVDETGVSADADLVVEEFTFEAKPNLIRVTTVNPGQAIETPLSIRGEARGYWFFEASFPVVLTNWDGLIIAEGFAQATDEWMTEDFVPFTVTLEFDSPYHVGDPDFMKRGTLILQKDNPSGLPEHDNALEIPITFTPTP